MVNRKSRKDLKNCLTNTIPLEMEENLTQISEIANNGLFTANNTWMLVSTVLVFIMHLGFSTLEAGFVQKKNVVNILFKNAMIISIGILTYFIMGFKFDVSWC